MQRALEGVRTNGDDQNHTTPREYYKISGIQKDAKGGESGLLGFMAFRLAAGAYSYGDLVTFSYTVRHGCALA
jgi:hypothetical protein